MEESLPIEGVSLTRDQRAVQLRSERPLAVLGSALVGAGLSRTRHVLNLHVGKDYSSLTPWDDLNIFAKELGIDEPFVGLMTAATPGRSQVVVERDAQTTVAVVATVGVSHPVAAGVSPAAPAGAGTINILLVVDARLSPAARVNAVITATEAKTLALVEAGVRAPHGGPASGTATDAVVVASTERGTAVEFAGPASPAGVLIATSVRRAVRQGLETS